MRGPAPLSLALAHVSKDATGTVLLSTWTETDFRCVLSRYISRVGSAGWSGLPSLGIGGEMICTGRGWSPHPTTN